VSQGGITTVKMPGDMVQFATMRNMMRNRFNAGNSGCEKDQ
jgi:hypothetical protein